MKHLSLFKLFERLAAKGWRGTLEGARRLAGLFMRVQLCVTGGLTKSHCLALYSMSKQIIRIRRKSGPLFLGKYLKQVAFLLMQYVGGAEKVSLPSATYVTLTRTGLPRFIPPHYRKLIRRGDDTVIRIVLSVCTLYRIILVPPVGGMKVNPSTVHQVGFQLSQDCKDLCQELADKSFQFLSAYAPSYKEIPLKLGFSFKPMFTSGPNTYKKPSRESKVGWTKAMSDKLTIYHTLPIDATALMTHWKPEALSSLGSYWFHDREIYPDSGLDPIRPDKRGVIGFGWLINMLSMPAQEIWWQSMLTRPELGRFGRKLEGAGKVRLFAIANPILQTLVRPLHDWVMSVLSTLKTDGTYDQLKPLLRLKGHRELFSFDLKAATDNLPVDLSGSILVSLFGQDFAQSWCFMMNMVGFRTPDPPTGNNTRARVYRFTRGQPLGYYSSWPVFTLTHHMLVWFAAWSVQPGKRFFDYAILGDDIVIACPKVAAEYESIMSRAMAVISKEKSLISRSGSCEFAKRFIVRNHLDRKDLSPLSIPLIRICYGFASAYVFSKLECNFVTSFRVRGAGYRVFSKIKNNPEKHTFSRLSRRWKRHWLILHSAGGIYPLPVELWLAYPEKGILNCYEIGYVRALVLSAVAPRDIDEKSIDELRLYYPNDDDNSLERMLKSFLQLHLNYLHWYATVLFDYSLPLSKLLDPPVSPRKIARVSQETTLVRHGVIFRLWDRLRLKETVMILSPLVGNKYAVETRIFRFKSLAMKG